MATVRHVARLILNKVYTLLGPVNLLKIDHGSLRVLKIDNLWVDVLICFKIIYYD